MCAAILSQNRQNSRTAGAVMATVDDIVSLRDALCFFVFMVNSPFVVSSVRRGVSSHKLSDRVRSPAEVIANVGRFNKGLAEDWCSDQDIGMTAMLRYRVMRDLQGTADPNARRDRGATSAGRTPPRGPQLQAAARTVSRSGAGEACQVLLAPTGGRASDPAAVWRHAAEDLGATRAGRLTRGLSATKPGSRRETAHVWSGV